MTIELADAQEIHRRNPVTFEVPTEQELDAIAPGDYVKVAFEDYPTGAERMWLCVQTVEGDRLTGSLSNYPTAIAMTYGDVVTFERRHICGIHDEPV
jgi:hypothetical protein